MVQRRRKRGFVGWALGVLAALTLVVCAPQHVLDLDETAGPVAAVVAHGHARTLIDHGQPCHACAGHCAAHVMADATAATVLSQPGRRPLIWAAAAHRDGRAYSPFRLDRPPKA